MSSKVLFPFVFFFKCASLPFSLLFDDRSFTNLNFRHQQPDCSSGTALFLCPAFLVKLVAEHYDRVIAANASTAQLKCAMQHLRVIHTPRTKSWPQSEEKIQWISLQWLKQSTRSTPQFLSLVAHLLWKPGGVCDASVMLKWASHMIQSWNAPTTPHCYSGTPNIKHFPIWECGVGMRRQALPLDIPKEPLSESFLGCRGHGPQLL